MRVTNEQAWEVTDKIYRAYGTGTGILFGIPSSLKPAVNLVVKATLMMQERENE